MSFTHNVARLRLHTHQCSCRMLTHRHTRTNLLATTCCMRKHIRFLFTRSYVYIQYIVTPPALPKAMTRTYAPLFTTLATTRHPRSSSPPPLPLWPRIFGWRCSSIWRWCFNPVIFRFKIVSICHAVLQSEPFGRIPLLTELDVHFFIIWFSKQMTASPFPDA